MTQVPPGWYPDPEMAGTQRYWSGTEWSDHVAPAAPVARAADDRAWVAPAAWVALVLFPPAGFVLSFFLPPRHSNQQAAIIILSIVWALLIAYVLGYL